jgi:hypothetical protein
VAIELAQKNWSGSSTTRLLEDAINGLLFSRLSVKRNALPATHGKHVECLLAKSPEHDPPVAAAYTKREQFPTRHDKAVRTQSIRGRMELDGLYVPDRTPSLPDLKAELLAFPHGRHDDIAMRSAWSVSCSTSGLPEECRKSDL